MGTAKFKRHAANMVDSFVARGVWQQDTLNDLLDSWAERTPDKIFACEASDRAFSFKDFSRSSQAFANALLRLGLRKGDVVAIQLPSSIEFIIAYFGVTRMGGILAPMHMSYGKEELRAQLAFSGAKAAICAPADDKRNRPEIMERLRRDLPELEHLIVARGPVEGAQFMRMADLCATGGLDEIADPPTAGDPALMCFTSGTSSAPKAVIHACETLLADARAYVKTIDGTQSDHSMIAPPFTHIFGLECVNNALCVGGSVVPLERFTPHDFSEMLERQQPTIVYAAPVHLAATLRDNQLEGRNLDSIRQVILGGSICPPSVAQEFEAHLPGGRVGILFGMTESLLVTQTPIDAPAAVRHGTVGQPVQGIEARIADADGTALGPGKEGELQLRGFTIMSGYAGNDAANAKAFTADGWFRCGDLAAWDEHGNIAITGRATYVINRGGVKINPSDVEAVISEHPAVVQVALIPKPDEIMGERICAVLVVKEGSDAIGVKELSTFLESREIAKARHPEHVVIVDEMPMTPTQKVIKSQLVKQIFPGQKTSFSRPPATNG